MPEPLRQRQPFTKDKAYLGFVARLPCIGCLAEREAENTHVQVAHLKWRAPDYGKRACGKSEKPSDRPWTLPLCPLHHVDARDAQHNVGEPAFWSRLRVNPFALCLALSDAYEGANPHANAVATIRLFAGPQRLEWREGLFA